MIFFYWLITVMTLDQHWLWGMEIGGPFTIIKLLGILCLLIGLFRLVTGAAAVRHLYRSAPAKWVMAFLLILAFGAARSLPANVSTSFGHFFSILALWITVLTLVDSRVRLHRTVLCAVGSSAIASVYAVRQHALYGGSVDGFRSAGIFSDSNQYALIVGLWLPLAFLFFLDRQLPSWERVFFFGGFAVVLLGTFTAASRGGFVGLIAAFLYVIVRSRRPFRNLLAVVFLCVPLLFWPASPLLRRLSDPSHGDQRAQDARLIVWRAGLRMIERYPLMGVGMHDFKSRVLEFENSEDQVTSLAHNSYLEVAAEQGLPGFCVYLGLFLVTLVSLERVRRRAQMRGDALLSNTATGLQAGLISYLFSSFFLSAWFEKMLWLLIFASIALYRIDRQLIRPRRRPVPAVPDEVPEPDTDDMRVSEPV